MEYTNKSREQLEAEGYRLVSHRSYRIKDQNEKCREGDHDMEYPQALGVIGGRCRNCGYSTM